MQHSHGDHAHTACCHHDPPNPGGRRLDWFFWGLAAVTTLLYLASWPFAASLPAPLPMLGHHVRELLHQMWWGVAFGFVAILGLSFVPAESVVRLFGRQPGFRGILKASIAGILLDLCSHGILMVGAKLYKQGVRTSQVMAFLIASPWNSLSLTLILFSLIGWQWTLLFILASFVIAILSGLLFDALEGRGILPANPHTPEAAANGHSFRQQLRQKWAEMTVGQAVRGAFVDAKMVVKWLLFGVVLAALIRQFVPMDIYQTWFGPTFVGLMLTLAVTTVIEVCSEGSVPIAADLLTRAAAPGNAFVFLMAGVATDYTEILVLRDTTKSWKIALALPLITVPQIMLLGWIVNMIG